MCIIYNQFWSICPAALCIASAFFFHPVHYGTSHKTRKESVEMLIEMHIGNMLPHTMPRSPNGCSLLILNLAYLPRFFEIKLNKYMHRRTYVEKLLLIKRLNMSVCHVLSILFILFFFSLLIEWGQQSFHSQSNATAADVVGFSIQNAVFSFHVVFCITFLINITSSQRSAQNTKRKTKKKTKKQNKKTPG